MRYSILGFFNVGMTTLSMLSVSCVLYSAGSGVKMVLVVLSGLRWSWFFCVHEAISCKYGCSFACAICLFVSVDVIVMSSAYTVMLMLGGGDGMSEVYMLKRVGESTPP